MKHKLLATAALVLLARSASAYVEIPYTLGRVVNESTNIVVMQVEKVNKERRLVYYKKIADLKGKHPVENINHQLANGFHPREPQYILDWAQPGKTAIFFYQGGASETCIGDYWYQSYAGNAPWWSMSHAEPFFCWCFSGKPEKLQQIVTDMLAGKEVVTPCAQFDPAKVQQYKNLLHEKKAPLWRMKASLKIVDYDAVMRAKNQYVVGLGALGPEAVPGFIAQLAGADRAVKIKAIEELGGIGSDAKPAVEPLAALLGSPDAEIRVKSADAVLRIDPTHAGALKVLTDGLNSEDTLVSAINMLGGLGGSAKGALPALAAVLKNPKSAIRLRTAENMLLIDGSNADAVNALNALLEVPADGKTDWVTVEAAEAKSAGGATANKEADKSVLFTGTNPDKETYSLTYKVDRKRVTALRLEALSDARLPAGGPGRAENGNFVLSKVTLAQGANVAKLKSAWSDFNQGGFEATQLLGGGPYGWAVSPEFGKTHVAIFSFEQPLPVPEGGLVTLTLEFQQQWARHQIGKVRLSFCDSDDPLLNVRVRSAELLGGVGTGAKAAIPTLMRTLIDPDGSVRAASATALSRMAPDSIGVLTAALKDAKPEVRSTALDALSQAGEHTAAAIPALTETLKDADAGIRHKSLAVLRPFAARAGGALPQLTEFAKSPDAGIRHLSIGFLADMGAASQPALPLLIDVVKSDPNVDVRAVAALAIGRLGQAGKDANAVLADAVNDPAIPEGHGARFEIAKAWGFTKAPENGPVVNLLQDDSRLFVYRLYNGDTGNFGVEDKDKHAGANCVRIGVCQRYAEFVAGWNYPIVEKPAAGQYRFIRYAWKKKGGTGIMIQLCNNGEWARRYHAGANSVNWQPSLQVDAKMPGEWTVVTRDLFKDFGPFTLTGIALTTMDGELGYYDSFQLARTLEDLDKK